MCMFMQCSTVTTPLLVLIYIPSLMFSHVISHVDCVRYGVYVLEISSPRRFASAAQILSILSILGTK